jgi:hypothetical protein
MAKRHAVKQIYQRVFFDYLLMVGVIFLALSYIMRQTWLGAFTEAMAIIVGIMWSYRAINTNPSKVFRLMAALVLVLLGSLLAIYLGKAHGLI